MERIVIEGFEDLTEQQMFDMSLDHIGTTRKASLRQGTSRCLYTGSGCNAAPFLTKEGRKAADEVSGYSGWAYLAKAGHVPSHNLEFVDALQGAHDYAATRGDSAGFLRRYVNEMREVAQRHNLDTTKLDALEATI